MTQWPKFQEGDPVWIRERTPEGDFWWKGEVVTRTEMKDTVVLETVHRRNPVTHPQWRGWARAYEKTWTKHFSPWPKIKERNTEK